VSSATLSAGSNSVQLATSPMTAGQSYHLSVSGVRDNVGITMVATNVSFTVFVLQDIGNPTVGATAAPVAGGFDLTAGGTGLNGSGTDQFSFEYAQRSGDFDVKVRLAGLSPSDAWAKAG